MDDEHLNQHADENGSVVTLEGDLTIATAADVYAQLSECRDASSLRLDASAVGRVDACGTQLLVSFARARENAQTTTTAQLSDEIVGALTSLGFDSDLFSDSSREGGS